MNGLQDMGDVGFPVAGLGSLVLLATWNPEPEAVSGAGALGLAAGE